MRIEGAKEVLISEADKASIKLGTCADPVEFCRFFLTHLFPEEMPWVHRAILAILTKKSQFLLKYGNLPEIVENFTYLDKNQEKCFIFHVFVNGVLWGTEDLKRPFPPGAVVDIKMNVGRFTLIMMPRGFSKTTLAGIAVPLYNILFEIVEMTAYVSEAGPHAKMQLDNVRRELSGNEKITAIFGVMKPKLSDDEKWSSDFFETKTGMSMAARGRGAQIRGLNHMGQRPKLIICDDLEDRESVETDVQRVKVRTWAYGDLMPAIDERENSGASIVALGTMLHKQSLLSVWMDDPEWTVVKMKAHDSFGNLLWPLVMDEKKYQAKKVSYAQAGLLHTFYMEYDNTYRSPETAVFKEEFFHYRQIEDPVVTAIYIDPAISDAIDADSTCIVVASMTGKGQIHIRAVWMKRGAGVREQIDTYFRMAQLWKCHLATGHGVEVNAYQKALVHLLQEEMHRQSYYFEVVKFTHTQKKDMRIRGILAPRFAGGYIDFDQKFVELETQLLDYPSGKVDGPDALAGVIALLDPQAGLASSEDPFKDEYEPLEENFANWAA